MVFFFTVCNDKYICFMGKDKHENEILIEYGLPHDVWFHVDKESSAHVYLRLPEGETMADIPADVLEDVAQLTKANSIKGCKMTNINIVYTMHSNLRKTAGMATGQIGFHNDKAVKKIFVPKRINDIVNRLNKTKEERKHDFRRDKEQWKAEQEQKAKAAKKAAAVAEKQAAADKKAALDLLHYKDVMQVKNMKSNRELVDEGRTVEDIEDDFM